ncbi:type IV secretion system protein [Sphingomonas sp. SUN039]|uniref:type IV secretion system protein n=1 Tax=Sphingomonas sp. SUN039 TaxID=2937787 RepID=UPI002164A6F1|nr:type IV secretion system protein [Sphingomonas sp. SUN039]UVO52824.1 type IV secretion system protein [Sphingomonas sp. SUN039]
MPCTAPSIDQGLLGGLLDYLDCQTIALGGGGYQALAAPGSSVSLALTGLLTLFVALLGYRMLFGQTPGVRDGFLSIIKIGIVLALAASWPAYQTLVYDVVLKAPAELATEIGAPAALPGVSGGLVQRLDGLDQAFLTLAVIEQTIPASAVVAGPGVPPPTLFDGWGLAGARLAYLTGTAAALAAARLVAGLLLALGPLFIGFLLFDGTRGLFEGWVRGLAGAALGALGTSIALGVELAFLEPRLAELIVRRGAGEAIPGAAVELLMIALVFALVLAAILAASVRLALGFRLPWWRAQSLREISTAALEERRFLPQSIERTAAADRDRPRAAAVADAVAANQRRESEVAQAVVGASGPGGAPRRRVAVAASDSSTPFAPPVPLGQSFRRRTSGRVSAASGRRDAA